MKLSLNGVRHRFVVVVPVVALIAAVTMHAPGALFSHVASEAIAKDHATQLAKAGGREWDQVYANLALSFEANCGQSDPEVLFLSRGHGSTLFLTSAEAVLVISKTQRKRETPPIAIRESKIKYSESAVLRMRLSGAQTQPQVRGDEELPGKSNYFIGSDPAKWHTNVRHYAKVRYAEVYPGIDLVYYGNEQQLEFDFVVAPGANPGAIRLAFEGNQGMAIEKNGDLIVKTKIGHEEVRLRKPTVYQLIEGTRREVEAKYMLSSAHEVSLKVGLYTVGERLIIDPVLRYSAYGGNATDVGTQIAVDGAGNAYFTGSTNSTNFPTANPIQAAYAFGFDAFVAKLNAEGSALVYSTYLGGGEMDGATALALDGSGNAYVTGYTNSTNFPTASPLQPTNHGSGDAFVSKLNASGSALLYSTYLGGLSEEKGLGIAVDSVGNAYVTGYTNSTNFPTATPVQPTYGGDRYDAFVAKLNVGGAALLYSTYLGGNSDDYGYGIALDGSGNAYVTGYTQSTNFPTASPTQPAYGGGGNDAFVAKLNAEGSALLYSTYLGGNSYDYGFGIAVDSAGNCYVTGDTVSSDFPTVSPFQPAFGGGIMDAFVAKWNPAGSMLLYSTYLGGSATDEGAGIAVDSLGNAYLTGQTTSTNFPTVSPLQSANGSYTDAFVAKLNAAGSALIYSTYLGGHRTDSGMGIAVDAAGTAYVIGYTDSSDYFPTASPLQWTYGGETDAFVAKISEKKRGQLVSQ